MKTYEARALFEVSFDANGSNFLLIYGKHVNGYYCCIPNWKISCEMAAPEDTFYNYEKLRGAGLNKADAEAVAQAIKEAALRASQKPNSDIVKTLAENLYFALLDNCREFTVVRKDRLARAYNIAAQLVGFGTVDLNQVEKYVSKMCGVAE